MAIVSEAPLVGDSYEIVGGEERSLPTATGAGLGSLFRLFRFRELAGKGCSASEPHRCTHLGGQEEVGIALLHNSEQQGKRYNKQATRNPPPPPALRVFRVRELAGKGCSASEPHH